MNASEARKLAQDRWRNMNHAEHNQYENVLSSIRQVISRGECYTLNYHQKLPESVVKKLQDDKYSVVDRSDRDGTLIVISWDGQDHMPYDSVEEHPADRFAKDNT